MKQKERIVAEITKNWTKGLHESPLLCTQFELIIETNRLRGYELETWRLAQLYIAPDRITETIIAVFRLKQ